MSKLRYWLRIATWEDWLLFLAVGLAVGALAYMFIVLG